MVPPHWVQVRPATEAEDRIFSRLVQLDRFVADTKKQVFNYLLLSCSSCGYIPNQCERRKLWREKTIRTSGWDDNTRARPWGEGASWRSTPGARSCWLTQCNVWKLQKIAIAHQYNRYHQRVCDTCQEDFCYGRCEAFQYQDSQVTQIVAALSSRLF